MPFTLECSPSGRRMTLFAIVFNLQLRNITLGVSKIKHRVTDHLQ